METISKKSLDYSIDGLYVSKGPWQLLYPRQQLISLTEVKPHLSDLSPEKKVLWLPSVQDLSPAVPQINSHPDRRV